MNLKTDKTIKCGNTSSLLDVMDGDGVVDDEKGLINCENKLEIEQLNIGEVTGFVSLAGTKGQKGVSGSIFST